MKRGLLGVCAFALGFPAYCGDYPAVLDWVSRAELSPAVSGTVVAVPAEPGRRVKQGEILVALDPTHYKAQLVQARAAVGRLKEEAADAKRELERAEELYRRAVTATSELDATRVKYARATGLLAEAEARLESARRNLEDAELRAPFDAIVVSRRAAPGQYVAVALAPQPLVVVARHGEMLARARVGAAVLDGLQEGQKVGVDVRGRTYRGTVTALGWEPIEARGEPVYALEVRFTAGTPLRAGTPALIRIP